MPGKTTGNSMRMRSPLRNSLFLFAFLTMACTSTRPWTEATQFTMGLACDMSSEEIRELAKSFPELFLHQPHGHRGLLVGQKGNTLIHLELAGYGLRAFQVSWTSGFTKQSSALKNDICSGQKLVQLHVLGDPKYTGASVLLNNDQVGELSRQGTRTLDVPLGVHTLTVKKGSSSWSTKRRYNSSSSGYDRLQIPTDAFTSGNAAGSEL